MNFETFFCTFASDLIHQLILKIKFHVNISFSRPTTNGKQKAG